MHKYRKYFEAEIGGKVRPLKIGTNTTAMYCDLRDCTLADFNEDFSPENLKNNRVKGNEYRDLVYCALKDGERFKISRIDPQYPVENFTQMDVGDWIDEWTKEQSQEFLKKYLSVVAESLTEVVQESGEDSKKK